MSRRPSARNFRPRLRSGSELAERARRPHRVPGLGTSSSRNPARLYEQRREVRPRGGVALRVRGDRPGRRTGSRERVRNSPWPDGDGQRRVRRDRIESGKAERARRFSAAPSPDRFRAVPRGIPGRTRRRSPALPPTPQRSRTRTRRPALPRPAGGDEPVGPAADDDDVEGRRAHRALPRISSAASRPEAPMIPPPGCVPAPHCQYPSIGVRYLRPPRHGTQEEQLLQRQLALEDVSLGQPGDPLDVERRQDLPVQDQRREVRRVAGERRRPPHRRTPRAWRRSSRPSARTARTARRCSSRACPAAPSPDRSSTG
mgnify:CR=1 FL=1